VKELGKLGRRDSEIKPQSNGSFTPFNFSDNQDPTREGNHSKVKKCEEEGKDEMFEKI